MKFGLQFQLQTPRPADADTWGPEDESKTFKEALEQIQLADSLGYDYVFFTEHHFLEEYCHSSAPEVFLAAVAAKTTNIRLGHGIVQMPPSINHPARVAERISALDIVSDGRVEFGTGEGATEIEIGGYNVNRKDKKDAWEEATRECLRMMQLAPYPGYEGQFFSMPERNVIPKPIQKPHPPVWVAAARRETMMAAGRLGIGSLGLGFDTPDEIIERVERYWELIQTCRRPLGAAVNPAVFTSWHMHCAPTNEEAIDQALAGSQFFGFVHGWMNGYLTPGRDNIYREFLRRRSEADTNEATEAATELEPEEEGARSLYRMSRRGLFIGSPDFLRKSVADYEAAHVDGLIFFCQSGDRKHEEIMASMELFAKEVMPEFKERHHLQQEWRKKQLADVNHPISCSI